MGQRQACSLLAVLSQRPSISAESSWGFCPSEEGRQADLVLGLLGPESRWPALTASLSHHRSTGCTKHKWPPRQAHAQKLEPGVALCLQAWPKYGRQVGMHLGALNRSLRNPGCILAPDHRHSLLALRREAGTGHQKEVHCVLGIHHLIGLQSHSPGSMPAACTSPAFVGDAQEPDNCGTWQALAVANAHSTATPVVVDKLSGLVIIEGVKKLKQLLLSLVLKRLAQACPHVILQKPARGLRLPVRAHT